MHVLCITTQGVLPVGWEETTASALTLLGYPAGAPSHVPRCVSQKREIYRLLEKLRSGVMWKGNEVSLLSDQTLDWTIWVSPSRRNTSNKTNDIIFQNEEISIWGTFPLEPNYNHNTMYSGKKGIILTLNDLSHYFYNRATQYSRREQNKTVRYRSVRTNSRLGRCVATTPPNHPVFSCSLNR